MEDLADQLATWEPVKTANTGSSRSIETAVSWIDTCTGEHSLCTSLRRKSQEDQSWLPTRLLEVGSNTSKDDHQTIYLRENLGSLQDSRYATLTYCRGSKVSSTLTTANLAELKNGIFVSHLPRTFRDAIWMTHRLGIRYLWIDALCILQDVEQDWLYEGVTMSNLYTYSHINFCATASEDSSGGLFFDREPSILNGCQVDVSWEDAENGEYLCVPLNAREKIMTSSPLSHRAWAVQETLLSSRTIFFASDQLYWECCESRCTEAHPHKDSWGNKLGEDLNHKSEFAQLRKGKSLSQAEFVVMWGSILRDYTLGRLSRPSDKLMAISGIAQAVKAIRPNEEYLAGLWRSDLLRSLLWIGYPGGEKSSRFETYVAPSWSWASVEGPVYTPGQNSFFDRDEKVLLDILEASTSPMAGPVGPVNGGHIKLRGRLCPVELGQNIDFPEMGSLSLLIDGHKMCEWYVIAEVDDEKSDMVWSRCQDLFCLQFTHNPSAEKAPEERTPHVGLIKVSQGLILQATKSARGQFCRVGYWNTRCWSDYRQITDLLRRESELRNVPKAWRLLRGFNDHKVVETALGSGKVNKEYYETFDGTDRYTITIV